LLVDRSEAYYGAEGIPAGNRILFNFANWIDRFSPSPFVGEGGVRGTNPISPFPLSSPIEGEEITGFRKLDSHSGVQERVGVALVVNPSCERQ
jgi:hypothetical protein